MSERLDRIYEAHCMTRQTTKAAFYLGYEVRLSEDLAPLKKLLNGYEEEISALTMQLERADTENGVLHCEIDNLTAERDKLDAHLESAGRLLDGYELCCCGNAIKDHGYTDEHGAVSMFDHHISCLTDRYVKTISSLEQENARYKAALEIMDIIPPPHYDEDWYDIAMKLKAIAREALKGEPNASYTTI